MASGDEERRTNGLPVYNIDKDQQRALSQYIRRCRLPLDDAVRFWRGQNDSSEPPNPALRAHHLDWLLHNFEHRGSIVQIAKSGVYHSFAKPTDVDKSPRSNHKSAVEMANALRRSVRDGQDNGTYMVVDDDILDYWDFVQTSPFACVPKADADPRVEARVIHDLSFPRTSSTNCHTDGSSLPTLRYTSVAALARRIDELRNQGTTPTMMLKGDVKSAFRHIHVSPAVSRWFVGCLPDEHAVVLDLSLPFGWKGSPAHYGMFGSAISFLVRRESPRSLRPGSTDTTPFFSYEWVDDHILIEPAEQERLVLSELALRMAMVAVLGPRAINEKKFSKWSTELKALGLEWNTTTATVSMPVDKTSKAKDRVRALLTAKKATKSTLAQVLGSLRHVCSCFRPAKPLYQRLVSLWKRAPEHASTRLSTGAVLDLEWFSHVLEHGRLRGVPTRFFGVLPGALVKLYMDASDLGLCVLNPSVTEYIPVQFDNDERTQLVDPSNGFTINVREQLSAVLAVLTWGPQFMMQSTDDLLHVKCWIDNQSAVAWINKLSSPNSYAQELNRILGAVEAQWSVRLSAAHIAGGTNYMADLGSRAWDGPRQQPTSQDLSRRILALQRASLADTSRRQYQSTWNQWCRFCSDYGYSKWLPHDDRRQQSLQLALFAVLNWWSPNSGRPNAVGTVQSKISHIGWYHRAYRGFSPALQPDHQLVINGMRRTGQAPQQRDPVSTRLLRALANGIDFNITQQRVILGAALLGFFFLLRSAEYLGKGSVRHAYALEVRDVVLLDARGVPTLSSTCAVKVKLHLRASKTDQAGAGTTRWMVKSGDDLLCPVLAAALLLRNARQLRLRPTTPICSVSPTTMLTSKVVTNALRWAAAKSGLDPTRFSCHSLRIGGATVLLEAGVEGTVIKQHGRWRSAAFERYTRLTADTAQRLTSAMIPKTVRDDTQA